MKKRKDNMKKGRGIFINNNSKTSKSFYTNFQEIFYGS